jgi:centromere protein C
VDDESGLRRGRRTRYRPLDWWRLERVEYGRGKELAEIKKIITLPKEPVKPLAGRKKGSRKPISRAKSRTAVSEEIDPEGLQEARRERWNPEEGWDKATEPDVQVKDAETGKEVLRRE